MSKKIAVIGGGGFAKEIIEVIQMNGDEVYGIFAKSSTLSYRHFGYLDELLEHKEYFDGAILAIGAVNKEGIANRRAIMDFLKEHSINLISVISPLTTISPSVKIGDGVYIAHGVTISCDTKIGDSVLINNNALIGHDVFISENVSIAPQVFLGGGVIIEKDVMLGVGATLRQGIRVGSGSIVGMRSIIIKNIKPDSIVLHPISKIYKA